MHDSWGEGNARMAQQAAIDASKASSDDRQKLIYGQSMNTPVFDEGYRPDNAI